VAFFQLTRKISCCCVAVLPFVLRGLSAQTASLTLSSATAEVGGAATLDLSLHSSVAQPVALQWTFHYPSSDISNIAVDDGPMITSAGKTVLCAGDTSAYKCLVVGANAKAIANGVVAKVTATLTPGVKKTTIALSETLGTSANGDEIPISAVAGTISSSKSNGRSPETRSRKRNPQGKSEHP
jgi:hypothetical protein